MQFPYLLVQYTYTYILCNIYEYVTYNYNIYAMYSFEPLFNPVALHTGWHIDYLHKVYYIYVYSRLAQYKLYIYINNYINLHSLCLAVCVCLYNSIHMYIRTKVMSIISHFQNTFMQCIRMQV